MSDKFDVEPWPPRTGGMTVGTVNGVKVTHRETQISASCQHHRSQHKNYETALAMVNCGLGKDQ